MHGPVLDKIVKLSLNFTDFLIKRRRWWWWMVLGVLPSMVGVPALAPVASSWAVECT